MTAHGPGLHDYPATSGPPQPPQPPQPPRKRWYRRRPAWIGIGVIAMFSTALIAILAAATTPSAPGAPSTSDGAVSPPAGAPQPEPTASAFTMPNEVGANLQKAQDDIQRTSGNPLFITRSEDATGAGRHQILDRNWKVCSQNVPTGTNVDQSVAIVLGVVQLTESCP